LGRICQGIRDIDGTNTAFFVDLTSIQKIAKSLMANSSVTSNLTKLRKQQVRLTVGGDILDYNGDIAVSTTNITTFKILTNSTLST
jgi:hypothetical protein